MVMKGEDAIINARAHKESDKHTINGGTQEHFVCQTDIKMMAIRISWFGCGLSSVSSFVHAP
eukprot:5639414-Pleurochrysis_carterae.AAC.1